MIFGIVAVHRRADQIFYAVARRRDLDGHRTALRRISSGDVVEIEITGIGTLRNKFVAETA